MKHFSDLVAGYYGFGNFGDDLFADILESALREKGWTNPVFSKAMRRPLDRIVRNSQALYNIAGARSITLGGGSILGARSRISIRHAEIAAARLKKIPYCAIGVGVLENLSNTPTRLIESMSWIGLRSLREHADLSSQYPHVHYTSDLAYAAASFIVLPSDVPGADRPSIVLIPAGVGELGQRVRDDDFLDSWIRGNVAPLVSTGGYVSVLLMQPTNLADLGICQRLCARIHEFGIRAELVQHRDSAATLSLVSSTDLVLTDRLHGAIAAHLSGVPFRLSKHHAKCVDWLTDIQHPDAVPERSYARDVNGGGLAQVDTWHASQASSVRNHASHATEGIGDWLAHLENRIS